MRSQALRTILISAIFSAVYFLFSTAIINVTEDFAKIATYLTFLLLGFSLGFFITEGGWIRKLVLIIFGLFSFSFFSNIGIGVVYLSPYIFLRVLAFLFFVPGLVAFICGSSVGWLLRVFGRERFLTNS